MSDMPRAGATWCNPRGGCAGRMCVVTRMLRSVAPAGLIQDEARAASLLGNTCVASIGPITTETARRRGLRVDVTAPQHTIPGLVSALEAHFDLTQTGTRAVSRS